MTKEKEYLVQYRIKNGLLFKKIEEKGCASIKEFCEKFNFSLGVVQGLLSLKVTVFNKKGDLNKTAEKLLEFFQATPDELFPARQFTEKLLNNKKQYFADEQELVQIDNLLDNEPSYLQIEEVEKHKDDEAVFDKLFNTMQKVLTPREERVIRLRYGIDCRFHTLEEAAKILAVTRERVRQIETRAMGKLQHPNSKLRRSTA